MKHARTQVEVTTLRRYLAKQPTPSTSEPITLPPPLLSLLLPHMADPLATESSSPSSSSVMVALTQRAKLLQEENDELYELLKRSETGRLKEEVRGLRRAMKRMEGALTGE
jgi:WTAP/Mum2p family